MAGKEGGPHIRWYRTPIGRETLAKLNARSDAKGFAQTLGYLGLMAVSAGLALFAIGRWPWWVIVTIVFLHGTIASFVLNGVHELVHKSVFKTQVLNGLFVRILSFIGWVNFEHFYASHMRHHQFTLHPPEDLEVVLPIRILMKQFFHTGFINMRGGLDVIKNTYRHACGRFVGEWETRLFPGDHPEAGRPVIFRARALIVGHAAILGLTVYTGWWLLPVLTSLTPFYGSWLFFLCNNTQHIGLQDKVPDFRLCCRTFTLNPLVRFLYWHMNYHIEHHMYAAVPCYNLARLHSAICHDLAPCPRGLLATWKEIAAIQKIQRSQPLYQHKVLLPLSAPPPSDIS
jgi:fatty acid desaturase